MDIRDLPLDELVLDPNLNLRDRLDDFTVERYAEAWQRLPPITVYEVEGRWLLADGFHRHAAAVMLGKKSIPAEVREGTFDDPRDRGGREVDAPPWDDATTPLPAVSQPPAAAAVPLAPWQVEDPKAVALSDPVPAAAPTIDEMLALMAKQVMEVTTWTQAEGF